MITWEVRKVQDQWELILRSYAAQGIRPEYHKICNLSADMAEFLVDGRLAGDLYGTLRKEREANEKISDNRAAAPDASPEAEPDK